MPSRIAAGFLVLLALIAGTNAARADVNCGPSIPATMIDTMSSAHSFPGERFRFKTTAPATHGDIDIPMGTLGWGIVRYVHHAETHNRGGLIVLEPRELVVGTTEVNIMADPRETAEFAPASTLAEEALGLAPIGLLGTAINLGRFGRDVTLGPGFNFHVIIVDDIAEKEPCVNQRRQSSPSPSPSPSPSASP
jgi:hypothetical protein